MAEYLTSAGVYKSDGTLVRTLWSGRTLSTGLHTEIWDGLLDDGTPAPIDDYEIKVLSNNVTYEWEGGMIGNTSNEITGDTRLNLTNAITSFAKSATNIYWSWGYAEGKPSGFVTTIEDPNSKAFTDNLRQTNQSTFFVTADNSKVYWAGLDPFDDNYETFVYAINQSDNSRVIFSNGVPATMQWGSTYNSTVGYKSTPRSIDSLITGLTVQQNGDFLFISRGGVNELQVIDKNSGFLVQLLNITGIRSLEAVDNILWAAEPTGVKKYTINNDGSLTNTGIIINIITVGDIAGSPDKNTIAIADIDTEQVKGYNTSGLLQWTLGTGVSYIDNSTVEDDKFCWKTALPYNQDYKPALLYLPDGSFYVNDPHNRRIQHFSNNRILIQSIGMLGHVYSMSINPNDTSRLLAGYLEFSIDHSQSIKNCWILTKNWGAGIDNTYDSFEKLRGFTTLSNGRTYCSIRKQVNRYIAEMVNNGPLRITNILIQNFGLLDTDGGVIYTNPVTPEVGSSFTVNKLPLLGFDSNNDLLYGSSYMLASTPIVTINDNSPFPRETFNHSPVTNDNKVIFFDYSKGGNDFGNGYHLGAININDNKWLWRTAKSTLSTYSGPFPKDGAFDNGNGVQYAGSVALNIDHNIFWGYHGEFWKQSQTNKWNHVYDNGLFVGQFGELGPYYRNIESPAGMAGNALSAGVIEQNGSYYLYHGDESYHGGVHRWKISNLASIQIQTATFPSATPYTPDAGIDLLAGLPRNAVIPNNTAGWTRTSSNSTIQDNEFNIITGDKTYDIFKYPDISIFWNKYNSNDTVFRTLNNNTPLTSWSLKGKINFERHERNDPENSRGMYFEVLDNTDKSIIKFVFERDPIFENTNFKVNGQLFYKDINLTQELLKLYFEHNNLNISVINGNITFKFADYPVFVTSILQDTSANWAIPSKLKLYFFHTVYNQYGNAINISELYFYKF